MEAGIATEAEAKATGSPRLAFLLSMAMFVLVVDTSLMNVSISAVVKDLGTTVSGVQSAIALHPRWFCALQHRDDFAGSPRTFGRPPTGTWSSP
jgi:hypothetical protein